MQRWCKWPGIAVPTAFAEGAKKNPVVIKNIEW